MTGLAKVKFCSLGSNAKEKRSSYHRLLKSNKGSVVTSATCLASEIEADNLVECLGTVIFVEKRCSKRTKEDDR